MGVKGETRASRPATGLAPKGKKIRAIGKTVVGR